MIENKASLTRSPLREMALECIEAAIRAVHPQTVIPEQVGLSGDTLTVSGGDYDLDVYENIYLLGGGNGAGEAGFALGEILQTRITDGVIVTDSSVDVEYIDVIESEYPIPSHRGMAGAAKMLDIAKSAGQNDLVLVVLTGGGSELLPAPTADISLDDLKTMTHKLYESGLDIKEINTVRKHLSVLKGGKLAESIAPATTIGLIFSDVVGNELEYIASGPISPDSTSFSDAISVIERHEIPIPDRVRTHLEQGYRGKVDETPSPGDPVFDPVHPHLLADGFRALEGAESIAEENGYNTAIICSHSRGDARELAKMQIGIAREVRMTSHPVEPPAVILTGGDITIANSSWSDTGPNQTFALSAAVEAKMEGIENIALASVATDGLDGLDDFVPAGGIVSEDTAEPQRDAWEALENHEVLPFLDRKDDLILIDVPETNVNDIHILVVGKE